MVLEQQSFAEVCSECSALKLPGVPGTVARAQLLYVLARKSAHAHAAVAVQASDPTTLGFIK